MATGRGREESQLPSKRARSRSAPPALAAERGASRGAIADFDRLVRFAYTEEVDFENESFEWYHKHVCEGRAITERKTTSWRDSAEFRDCRVVQAAVALALQRCDTPAARRAAVIEGADLRNALRAVRESFRARNKEATLRGARSDLGAPLSFPPARGTQPAQPLAGASRRPASSAEAPTSAVSAPFFA